MILASRRLVSTAGLALLFALLGVACGGGGAAQEEGTPFSSRQAASDAAVARATETPLPATPAATGAPSVSPKATAAPPPATPTATLARAAKSGDKRLAPELAGISSWINSEPFTLETQRGNVVLVDFWTYSCINCIRTLPYLREWHDKYADQGLVIVGVHTPEFEFEQNRENVVRAAMGFELEYPIAQDNDYVTWRLYQGKRGVWPAKYLIDRDGYVRYTHFGEGAYEETEQKIRELLSGAPLSVKVVTPEPVEEQNPLKPPTFRMFSRELYAGLKRNLTALPPYVYNAEYYDFKEGTTLYEDPGRHGNGFLYLQGLWHDGRESLRHARTTEDYEDYIAIWFFATSVNAVISPEGGAPFDVRVTLDGGPLGPGQAGADIMFDADGNSYVLVDEARMYDLVETTKFAGHGLTLSSNSADFSLYTFTFAGDG